MMTEVKWDYLSHVSGVIDLERLVGWEWLYQERLSRDQMVYYQMVVADVVVRSVMLLTLELD
jgi:hypothetical protein